MAIRMRMLVLVAALLLAAVQVQGEEVVASAVTIVAPGGAAVAAEDDKSSTVKLVPAAAPAPAKESIDAAVLADDSVTASNETATAEPATEELAAEAPATEEPTTEEPAAEEPAAEEPAAEEPATEEPATEEPATEELATEETGSEETVASEDEPTDGMFDGSFTEEGTLLSDDGEGDLSFEEEPSEDESFPEEASLADLPDGVDADVQDNADPLDFDDEAALPYGEDGVEESAAAPGVPPGFDVDETGEQSGNATDADVSDLSLAARGGGGCQTGNMIDDCWRCDPKWASRRQSLANCAQGFGKCAVGGRNGPLYWVTSARDDNPANPAKGTLRYAVTRPGPLWIVFKTSMTIKLKGELLVTSYKTIDGRGVTVRIAGGGGITLQRVSNVIIHGLYIHDIVPTGPGRIMSSTNHVGNRGRADGDAISVFSSKCVWIDHCYFARGKDGLVDVIRGSSMVTISNSFFTQHDKVILLGAHKDDYMDRDMKVTIMLNRFGPGLVQRMPRVRFGSCHIVNNDYTSGWGIYAIGGSERPVLNCEGNLFQPGRGPKGVAKKVWDGGGMYGGPKTWPWRATGNDFRGGAFFQTSGPQQGQVYAKATSCSARPVYMVQRMTRDAGPLNCKPGRRC